jgi:hypothetical protein
MLAGTVLGGSPFITETAHLLSWRNSAINSELIAISWHGVSVVTQSITLFHQTTSFLIALETQAQNGNNRLRGTLVHRGPACSSGYLTDCVRAATRIKSCNICCGRNSSGTHLSPISVDFSPYLSYILSHSRFLNFGFQL